MKTQKKSRAKSKSLVSRKVLPNGLVLIAEPMPHIRSVSIGIWMRAGSRGEPNNLKGIAHFLEHMVFKGTSRRTSEEIARTMDSVGGHLDAFTSKEMVSFSAKVLDEHLPLAFDVLSDLVLRPLFTEADIKKERHVILEEIRMEEDNPESVAHEQLTENFWRGHPLGTPILGTRASVQRFNRAAVNQCFRRWYAPNNIIISAAGNITMKRLTELARKPFGALTAKARLAPAGPAPKPQARLLTRDKPTLEQAHIALAVPTFPLSHPRRYALSILNSILGGSMSSRLFQNIRERQGLAYAVFSEINPYSDAGMLVVYAGTARNNIEKVLHSVGEEFRKLKQEPVSGAELRRAKDQIQGSLALSLESSGSRMSSLARQELYFGRFFTIEQMQASIEAVTREEMQKIAQECFQPEKIAISVVGPLKGLRLKRSMVSC